MRFVPFFGLFQIILQIIFASFVRKLHLFVIEKQKALGDFQIGIQIFFPSFVPHLRENKFP